jgi:predicted dehydrogenase
MIVVMNKTEVNFAIVGLGGIGREHAMMAYTANLALDLPFVIKLKNTVTRKPISNIEPYSENVTDLESILEDKSLDFVDICTPNDSHKAIALKAAAEGKAIYCEKPLALNYEEAKSMAEAIDASGVINGVALIYRFFPAIRMMKEEMGNGTIGDIIDFKINMYHKSYLNPNKKPSWRTDTASGGGALMDLGVHLIDSVEFVLGSIEKVNCRTRIYFKERTNVDEIAFSEFTLESGAKGSLEVSRIHADSKEPTTFYIYGTKGSMKLTSDDAYTLSIFDYATSTTILKNAKNYPGALELYPDERNSMGFHHDCHMASIAEFARRVYDKEVKHETVMADFKDALKAQRVVEACYESAAKNREVSI